LRPEKPYRENVHAENITIEECREIAEDLGQELYKRYDVPIYFTGKNARRPGMGVGL
jgi:glutamate formiminotransferase